jgi:hypothetical protein
VCSCLIIIFRLGHMYTRPNFPAPCKSTVQESRLVDHFCESGSVSDTLGSCDFETICIYNLVKVVL